MQWEDVSPTIQAAIKCNFLLKNTILAKQLMWVYRVIPQNKNTCTHTIYIQWEDLSPTIQAALKCNFIFSNIQMGDNSC